jgi:hypothetical protein
MDVDANQIHPRRQQKIKSLLENLNVDAGRAITISCSTTLKGSRSRSWTYTLSAVTGHESQKHHQHGLSKQKWNLHLESDAASTNPMKQICIKGEVDLPILPLWNIDEIRSSLIDFRYVNTIGFGASSCSESSIKVTGNAKVSHQQREQSRQSEDAEECQKLQQKNGGNAKLSDACERTRRQSEQYKKAEAKVGKLIKVALLPFLKFEKKSASHEQSENGQTVVCRLQFNHQTPSFDLTINGPEEQTSFSKIRIPYPLDLIFPMKAGENNLLLAAKKIVGNSVVPTCKIEQTEMTTFDNRSVPFHIDYCFHLLSGDCSADRKFGILTRTMKPGWYCRKQIIVISHSIDST